MPQRPRGLPKVFILVVVLSAATVFSIVDHVHDQQLSVALLYLSLVSIVAWYDSARSAAVLCVTVAAALLIDAVAFRGADGGRFIHYWNATQIVALCVVASAVVSRLKAALQAERELSWIEETTGLFRRAAFMELLTGGWTVASATPGRSRCSTPTSTASARSTASGDGTAVMSCSGWWPRQSVRAFAPPTRSPASWPMTSSY